MVQSYVLHWSPYKQHALKGQKLLSQGIALGIVTGRQVCEHDNPGRCPGLRASAHSGRVGQNLRNFGGAKLRITETSVKSPLEKVEKRIFVFATY